MQNGLRVYWKNSILVRSWFIFKLCFTGVKLKSAFRYLLPLSAFGFLEKCLFCRVSRLSRQRTTSFPWHVSPIYITLFRVFFYVLHHLCNSFRDTFPHVSHGLSGVKKRTASCQINIICYLIKFISSHIKYKSALSNNLQVRCIRFRYIHVLVGNSQLGEHPSPHTLTIKSYKITHKDNSFLVKLKQYAANRNGLIWFNTKDTRDKTFFNRR